MKLYKIKKYYSLYIYVSYEQLFLRKRKHDEPNFRKCKCQLERKGQYFRQSRYLIGDTYRNQYNSRNYISSDNSTLQ